MREAKREGEREREEVEGGKEREREREGEEVEGGKERGREREREGERERNEVWST